MNHPMEENPRVKQIAEKVRSTVDAEGKAVSKMKQFQLRDGILRH
ncbi:hypothetical protein MASR1M31_20330 [Porphyromonadaceae bacterium]